MQPSATRPSAQKVRRLNCEVLSMLAFGGSKQGTCILGNSVALAKRLCGNMLVLADDDIGIDELADGVGEMLNMMGGNYKNDWLAPGHSLDLSVPTTMFGQVGLTSMRRASEIPAVEFQIEGEALLFGIVVYG